MKRFTSILSACAMLAIIAALALATAAAADSIPGAHELDIPYGAGSAVWDVPTYGNGWLVASYAASVTNGATVAVRHLIPYGSGDAVLTNVVAATDAAGAWNVWPSAYVEPPSALTGTYVMNVATGEVWTLKATNVVTLTASAPTRKPVPLVPGEQLLFTLSATNGQATVILRTAGR